MRPRADAPRLPFTAAERRVVARLRTPAAVQHFLNRLPYNNEPAPGGATLRSFRGVVRTGTAHCMEAALAAAVILGGAIAVMFAQWRFLEISFFPYAVILQVTPIVAIAPLIIIWVNDTFASLLICAWIVAFFPIVANTTLGLNSADRNLVALFQLYGASRWQALRFLRLPSALPLFLAGVRISGGLALIGAVVAEFVAGTGGSSTGLASRILEAGYRLEIPRLFAALFLLSLTGILIFAALSWLSNALLKRWHESALPEEE